MKEAEANGNLDLGEYTRVMVNSGGNDIFDEINKTFTPSEFATLNNGIPSPEQFKRLMDAIDRGIERHKAGLKAFIEEVNKLSETHPNIKGLDVWLTPDLNKVQELNLHLFDNNKAGKIDISRNPNLQRMMEITSYKLNQGTMDVVAEFNQTAHTLSVVPFSYELPDPKDFAGIHPSREGREAITEQYVDTIDLASITAYAKQEQMTYNYTPVNYQLANH